MTRVCLPEKRQEKFLVDAKVILGGRWSKLAKFCNIHTRTLFDWRRNKYQMPYDTVKHLSESLSILLPENIKILPEYWNIKKAAKLGGKKFAELYGSPGTPDGRRKGGIKAASKVYLLGPEYARKIGFQHRKQIRCPERSSELAEFIGILLGDGGITEYQVSISFDKRNDIQFSIYCQKLIERLFDLSSVIKTNKYDNGADIVVSSKNLVEFLEKNGIKIGNKIKQQIDVPLWIKEDKKFTKSCLRGLMDTDGCVYIHRYRVNNKLYKYPKLCFSSHSRPLLLSVVSMFGSMGYKMRISKNKKKIYMDDSSQTRRYFEEIGTNNPRYLKRYLGAEI